MNKINTTNQIEKALLMYTETVSPPEDTLLSILNQIPEKENLEWRKQAIRSPYRWPHVYATSGVAVLCLVIIGFFPTIKNDYLHRNDPFYATDQQVEQFEAAINEAERKDMLLSYNSMNAI